MGDAKATAIAQLWGNYYNSIVDGNTAAAFQLAIWKIEYDWGDKNYDTFSAGNFRASGNSTATTDAEQWIQYVYNNPGLLQAANLWALSNPNIQDQITQLDGGDPVAAPVPPTFLLGGVGCLSLLAYAWLGRKGPSARALSPA